MTAYWPFWIAGPALALVTVGACLVGRRPLGVSGVLARLADLPRELRAERQREALASADTDAVEAALLAATLEAFGPAPALAGLGPDAGSATVSSAPALALAPAAGPAPGCGTSCGAAASRPTLGAHAVFLAAIVAGGFLVQLARGGWQPTFSMGDAFERLVAGGLTGWVALLAGGFLVGVGTAISGGCSTGHGLSGSSRLQPAGVAATATFFGVAVAVSFLLAARAG